MFERLKNRPGVEPGGAPADGRTAVADGRGTTNGEDTGRFRRTAAEDGTLADDRAAVGGPGTGALTREHVRDMRARQRDEYGGINWGAACFGWLVAVGLGAILIGLVAGAGAAVGLTQLSAGDARGNADTIGLGGAIAALVVLMIAYYAGGYVAGRMSRFDGARQGMGAWAVGIVVTIVLGALAAIFGSKYNVLGQLNLPRIPISGETLTTGGLITLAAVLLGTLVAAMAGGKVGERYHRRIDRVAVTD
jgi:amino acid transporter